MITMEQEEITPTTTTFIDWLQEQLNLRNWTAADLARRADITDSALSRIISKRDRKPGPELCTKIAKALDVEADEVFRLAGLLPEEKARELSEYQRELLGVVDQLDETSQRMLLEIAKGLVSRSNR